VTDAKSVQPAAAAGMSHPVLSAPVIDRSGFQGSTGAPPSGRCGGVPLDAALLRSLFSSTVPGTVGFEEELLLVHRGSWLPADAAAVVAGIGDLRVKPELLACQLEIATSVHEDVAGAVEELRSCRALLAAASGPDLAAIAAPVHPLLDRPTALSPTERAVGPAIAKSSAGSWSPRCRCTWPSVRPTARWASTTRCGTSSWSWPRWRGRPLRRRTGHRPVLGASGDHLLGAARRGPRLGGPRRRRGRVGVVVGASTASALLHARATGPRRAGDRGSDQRDRPAGARARRQARRPAPPRRAPTAGTDWRIAENRWAALRDGVRGELLDLRTGEARPTRRCLHDLIDAAEPYAPDGLDDARAMVEDPSVEHLRAAFGPEGVVPWLAEEFTA
jgi:carboxylate-amine ligase